MPRDAGDENLRVSETVARQVLARAAQLDASDRSGVSIRELRTAAVEAGISPTALDRALSEIEKNDTATVEPVQPRRHPPRRSSKRALIFAVVIAGLLGTYAVVRMVAPVPIEVEVPKPPVETVPGR